MRKILFSSVEFESLIAETLRPHLGVVVDVVDHKPMIYAVLDEYFFGCTQDDHKSIVEILDSYERGIFTATRYELIKALTEQILTLVTKGFGLIQPTLIYDYHVYGLNGILITESKPLYASSAAIEPRAQSMTIEEYRASEEAGDYIPERLRRRVS